MLRRSLLRNQSYELQPELFGRKSQEEIQRLQNFRDYLIQNQQEVVEYLIDSLTREQSTEYYPAAKSVIESPISTQIAMGLDFNQAKNRELWEKLVAIAKAIVARQAIEDLNYYLNNKEPAVTEHLVEALTEGELAEYAKTAWRILNSSDFDLAMIRKNLGLDLAKPEDKQKWQQLQKTAQTVLARRDEENTKDLPLAIPVVQKEEELPWAEEVNEENLPWAKPVEPNNNQTKSN